MKTPDIVQALELRAKIRKLDSRLSLDDVLDDTRTLNRISAGAFDYLMMAMRYETFLDTFLLNFAQKEVGPPRLKDFLIIGAAAIITRTREPAEKQSHAMVEITKKEWGKGASQFANAFFRNLSRNLNALKTEILNQPENLLKSELRDRWSNYPDIQKRAGRMLANRPTPEISGFNAQGEFLMKSSSQALEDWTHRSNFFQAIDLGSYLWMEQVFLRLKKSPPLKSTRVMDICAAPGAKFLLFQRLWSTHFTKTPVSYLGTDLKWSRLERLKENLEFYRNFYETDTRLEVADHCHPNPFLSAQNNPCEIYLADLPCSGSGTLHTRPDLGADITEALKNPSLMNSQRTILRNLIEVAKQNPMNCSIFLSVCSVDPLEIQNIETVIQKTESEGTIQKKWTSWHHTDKDCEGITGWILYFKNQA